MVGGMLTGCPESGLCLFTVNPNIGIVGWCGKVALVADVFGAYFLPLCCSSGIINTDSHLCQSPRNSNRTNPLLSLQHCCCCPCAVSSFTTSDVLYSAQSTCLYRLKHNASLFQEGAKEVRIT